MGLEAKVGANAVREQTGRKAGALALAGLVLLGVLVVSVQISAAGRQTLSLHPSASETQVTPPITCRPPSAPRNLRASGSPGEIVLNWVSPASYGGYFWGYTIYRGNGSGNESFLVGLRVSSDVTSYEDTAVTSGVPYFYQVSGTSIVPEGRKTCEGPRSNEVSAAAPRGAPTAPRNLRGIPADTSTLLTWNPPSSDGGSLITNYMIYRGSHPGDETFLTKILNLFTYTDPGLTNGQKYYYRVAAVNAAGEGPNSGEALAAPARPGIVPEGNIWTNPFLGPSGRSMHATAYDSAADRMIMFGGSTGGNETWTYEPSVNTWTRMTPTASPPARGGHSMVYDVQSDRVILFGGGSGANYLADTWAYDFNNDSWTNMSPPAGPSARYEHAMVYDSAARLVVLFGGASSVGRLSDTWAYDFRANTWTIRAGGPSPRAGHAIAYDSVSDRAVLFGGCCLPPPDSGSLADTWAYDFKNDSWEVKAHGPPPQVGHAMSYLSTAGRAVLFGMESTWLYDFANDRWTNMNPIVKPPAVAYHAMAYDSVETRAILFGGNYGGDLPDMWAYDATNNTWEDLKLAGRPSPRSHAATAYDSGVDRMILFGGHSNGPFLADTWAYDVFTNHWTNMSPATGPSSRFDAAMAYDAESDRAILFGGFHFNGPLLGDTWAYDFNSNTWTNMSPAVAPSPREGHSMVYDAAGDRVVLFGGSTSAFFIADTWAYDFNSNTWTNMSPAVAPSPREGHSMVYDAARQRVILFGGYSADGVVGDTWAYDTSSNHWTDVVPAVAPVARWYHATAYNSAADRVILFGGYSNGPVLADTWAFDFDNDTWSDMSPASGPFPRGGHSMVYDTPEDRVILFGGVGAASGSQADTWWYQFTSPGAPTPPQNLQATPAASGVDLAWQPPVSQGSSSITHYRIYRGTASGSESFLVEVGNVLRYTDADLTDGVSYFYQVSAVNAAGEGPRSNEVHSIPGTPTPPQSLQATPAASGVDLAWQPPVSQGSSSITHYRIYRGTASGSESFLVEVGNVLTYSDPDVTNDSVYYYQVSALNAYGEGPRGPEVTVRSRGGPVTPPFPWIPVVSAGLLVVTAACVVLLHSRILREDVLQRKVRMLMFEYTRDHPGASFSAVRDAMGLKNGVAAYHLNVLEKQGLVHSKIHRRHHWFYPNGDVSLWRDIPLSALQLSMIDEVRRAPGLGIRELARAVDRRTSSVAYNVKALVREDVLRTKRVGSKVRCFVVGEKSAR